MKMTLDQLSQINAGVTLERLEVALKEVAIGVANAEKNGDVTLKLKILNLSRHQKALAEAFKAQLKRELRSGDIHIGTFN